MFQGYFLEVSRVSTECFEGLSRKFQVNVQVVSKKFHAACHSLQLTEQKEGLFFHICALTKDLSDISQT